MVSAQRHLAVLRAALRAGEAERLWIRAERRPQGHAGVLLVTESRLLFTGLGFVQQSEEAWPLAGVASDGVDQGRPAVLTVTVPGGSERFAGRAADLRRVDAALPAATAAPTEDQVAALERLAALHAAGSLTDEEFARAKTRLLE